MICSGKPSFRLCPEGVLFGNGGPTLYPDGYRDELISFLNSIVCPYYMSFLNPTINYTKSDVGHLPFLLTKADDGISSLSRVNQTISRNDWDAHETSWDFRENELIRI